jgi:hypothetical protein
MSIHIHIHRACLQCSTYWDLHVLYIYIYIYIYTRYALRCVYVRRETRLQEIQALKIIIQVEKFRKKTFFSRVLASRSLHTWSLFARILTCTKSAFADVLMHRIFSSKCSNARNLSLLMFWWTKSFDEYCLKSFDEYHFQSFHENHLMDTISLCSCFNVPNLSLLMPVYTCKMLVLRYIICVQTDARYGDSTRTNCWYIQNGQKTLQNVDLP